MQGKIGNEISARIIAGVVIMLVVVVSQFPFSSPLIVIRSARVIS